jgi:glyoxylase-like metal-dependent hydrolase (beta-lactamase superfamily II)
MSNFVYLLTEPTSKEAMVIDSGWEIEPMLSAIEESESVVKYVVPTHSHFDHVSSIKELAEALKAYVAIHRDSSVEGDLYLEAGSELELGRSRVKVLHTPGHTQDSICIYDGKNLFTGDTLFIGTIGKFEKEFARAMFESLNTIKKLPAATVVYPGHDYGEAPFRTLREELLANPFLLTRDLRSFLSFYG